MQVSLFISPGESTSSQFFDSRQASPSSAWQGALMNIPINRLCTYFAVLWAMAGCNKDTSVAPMSDRVAALETRVELLEFQARLNSDVNDWDKVAYLTPGSDGYGVIKMDLGNLTVSLANIVPYANGSRVSLMFGNLTSATIVGLKAKIEWGPVDDKGVPIAKQTKSRDIKLTESLISGAWNKTDVVLEGVPPSALGFIRVRDVGHQAIRLNGRTR